MIRRWLLSLLILGCASCLAPAPAPGPEADGAAAVQTRDCGMDFVLKRLVPRPGSGRVPVPSGAAIPACALPTEADIQSACRTAEGVPIPGSQDPDDPESPRYAFPDYTVENAACTFTDPTRQSADCAFDLLGRPGGPQRIRTRVTRRFHDLSNSVAHNWLAVRWNVEAACAPPG